MSDVKHTPGLQVLIGYFGEVIAHHCSSADCNDMPQDAFEPLSAGEKAALLDDFLAWDKQANPDGWEPTQFEWVSDSSWGAYLMDRCERAVSVNEDLLAACKAIAYEEDRAANDGRDFLVGRHRFQKVLDAIARAEGAPQ